MKKLFLLMCCLLLALPLAAQQRTGNIYGKVVDQEGVPLPGASVVLTGSLTAPMKAVTTEEGNFRFLSLAPGKDYTVKIELQGFKTLTRSDIIVSLGMNTELSFTLEVGGLEEEVTVTAASPVIESKKTTISQTVSYDVLQSLPTSRDPWVILQQAAGVQVDRENVGGNESGQMASFIAKGGGTEIWSIDGASIEDPSSVSSITYFDFDAFDEMNITIGGGDVTIATGGVQVNLVTRRGSNKMSLGGRFYLTDRKFQANNLTDELRAEGVRGTNVIRSIKDYGFNAGGPMVKDKVWWWISYGVQDIWTNNIYGNKDDTLLQNYVGKLNFQLLPQNRFEAFLHVGGKEKFGRSSSYEFPLGYHQRGKYYFGTPILKLEDEHMFGDKLLLSAKYVFSGGGFSFLPMADEGFEKFLAYDETTGIYQNSYWNYGADRPTTQLRLLGNYFNDRLLGASHEFKFGVEYRNSTGSHYSTTPGNIYKSINYNYPTIDVTGDEVPDIVPGIEQLYLARGWKDNNKVVEYTGYASDTISFGRLNLILGLRYTYQKPKIAAFTMTAVEPEHPVWQDYFSATATSAIDAVLPGLNVPDITGDYKWSFLSPRIGLTYDVFGDGKTIAKLSAAQYGDFMGTGEASYYEPMGLGGWMNFWWLDDNANGVVDVNELLWYTASSYQPHRVFDDSGNFVGDLDGAAGIMWGDYDFDNPQQISGSRYTIDPSVNSARTSEVILSLERELLPDLGAALDLTYRKFDRFNWALAYDPETGDKEDKDEYVQVGTIPDYVGPHSTEDGAGKPYYLWNSSVPYRFYRYYERRPDYYRDFMGAELRVNKRLSNRWMLNASFTLQMQKEHYGDNGYLNPTNLWAIDGKAWAPNIGGASGKIGMNVFSRWLFKLAGLYQLPYDFNISFAFNAREGHIIAHTVTIVNYDAPNALSRSVTAYLEEFGTERLPTFYNLNLRLEKIVSLGETARMYLMADVFNVFNSAIMNRRYARHHGSYYVHDGSFVQNPTDFMANEILNPRVIRLGVRFQI